MCCIHRTAAGGPNVVPPAVQPLMPGVVQPPAVRGMSIMTSYIQAGFFPNALLEAAA